MGKTSKHLICFKMDYNFHPKVLLKKTFLDLQWLTFNVSLILVNPPPWIKKKKKKWGGGVPGRLIVNSKGTAIFLILGSVSGLLLYVWLGFIIVDYIGMFL